jgi:hypothetical protein
MSGSVADLTDRRLRNNPDVALDASIRGVYVGKYTHYEVVIDGESDSERAATILRAAASVLTDPESTDIGGKFSG